MDFKVDQNADVNGTHLQGHIEASYQDLEKAFGKPIESDGHKVSGEWIFVSNGEVFTLYDWKSTSLYDPCLPSVQSFRANKEKTTFNIGGRTNAANFIKWLEEKIK